MSFVFEDDCSLISAIVCFVSIRFSSVNTLFIGILFIAEYNILKQCHSAVEEVEEVEEVFEVVEEVVASEVAEEVVEIEGASEYSDIVVCPTRTQMPK